MKKVSLFWVLLGILISPVPTFAQTASKLHIVIVADYKAKNRLGPLVEISTNQWLTRLGEIVDKPEVKHKFHQPVVIGDYGVGDTRKLTPALVRNTINGLNVQNGESVLFLYLGHAHIENRTNFIFQFSGGDMDRTEVRQLLKETGAQGIFILTDCCSSFMDAPSFAAGAVVEAGSELPYQWQTFKNLFFDTVGLVDFTAAQAGQSAWFNKNYGGIFSNVLIDLLGRPANTLDSDQDGMVTWYEFSANVIERTNTLFLRMKSDARERGNLTDSLDEATEQQPWPIYLPPRTGQNQNQNQNVAPAPMIPVEIPYEPPPAYIVDLKTNFEVVVNGQRGIQIKVHFHTSKMIGDRIWVNAYFRDLTTGNSLVDFDNDDWYRSVSGQVAAYIHPTVTEDCLIATLFIPNEQLHVNQPGVWPLGYTVEIHRDDGFVLTTSRLVEFEKRNVQGNQAPTSRTVETWFDK